MSVVVGIGSKSSTVLWVGACTVTITDSLTMFWVGAGLGTNLGICISDVGGVDVGTTLGSSIAGGVSIGTTLGSPTG